MVGPLTSSPDVDAPDGDPLVVGVDDERADAVLSALSATTTRRVLAALHDDPAPPSALADRLDTSLQNVDYHLRKLLEAGLVVAAGTAYSEKGREMTVYAPADRALVFVAGPASAGGTDEGLVATLKRLLGGVGVLGLASVAVKRLLASTARQSGNPDTGYTSNQSGTVSGGAGTSTGGTGTSTDGAGTVTDVGAGDGAGTTTEAAQTATDVTEAATSAVDVGATDVLATSPGLLFFVGGLTALLFVAALRWQHGTG